MGYACAIIAIAGFIPTYWVPVASGSFDGQPILHLHGLLFTAWPLFFVIQATLAARGGFERHRALGYCGISLATAMLFTGLAVSIHSIEGGIQRGFEAQSRAFSIVPVTIILTFAALVVAAIANVRRPDVHMRLMLTATIALLTPAIARFLFLAFGPEGASRPGLGPPLPLTLSLLPSGLTDMLLAVPIVRDWRARGWPHAAYLYAAAFIVIVQIARVPFGGTGAWRSVTDWLLAFN
jgi:hypothetical protein